MRTDQKIYFVQLGKEEYDPTTGDYEVLEDVYTDCWANVSDMSEERMAFLFGGLKVGAYTIRILNEYTKPFDYIHMNNKDYNVKRTRTLRNKQTFEVSERL